MDKLGVKATLYDILGYFIPGATFLFAMWFLFSAKEYHSFEYLMSFELSWPAVVLISVLSYAMGHMVASLSSLLFENNLSKMVASKIYKVNGHTYDSRTITLFGTTYENTNSRILTSYCQIKQPIVYDTAFVFLSIYGFSRNISAILLVTIIIGLSKSAFSWPLLLLFFVSFFLMLHNYFRFKKYFALQIASALFMDSKE